MADPVPVSELRALLARFAQGDELVDAVRLADMFAFNGAALLAAYEERERLKEELTVLVASLHKGVRENDDGSYYMVWTREELDLARKRADEMCERFGIESAAGGEET